jgi:hypothetical protein
MHRKTGKGNPCLMFMLALTDFAASTDSIGNSIQQLPLFTTHPFSGAATGFMVIAEQMQQTMHQEEVQLAIERMTLLAGLSGRGRNGNDYVAEQVGSDMAELPFTLGE